MSKGLVVLLAGLALAALPRGAAGQEIGASLRILERAPQPTMTDPAELGDEVTAHVPAGWAFVTSRGQGGGARSIGPAALVRGETPVIEASTEDATVPASATETVTVMFVPL